MSQTKTQNFQHVNEAALEVLGKPARSTNESILDGIDSDLNSPLRLFATFPTPNSLLNFNAAPITLSDGAKRSLPPVKSQVYELPASTINFQTQATTGATFVGAWPVTNTVGQFRRIGFSLLGDGTIQFLFSDEAASVGALANPGTVFVKSGVAIGYLNLECTNASPARFKTAGSATNIIENSSIYRFSAGSGGGSGTGDANSFTENLKHRLISSYYEFVTPVVFETDEQTLTDSATAVFDVVDGVYNFTAGNQNFISVNLFDQEFLLNGSDNLQVELHAEWFSEATRDASATYEVALNGSDFETITMARQGLSSKYTGSLRLNIPSNSTISSQSLTDTDSELNATNLQAISAPITIASKSALRELSIELDKLGSPVGSYSVSLCTDNAGVPGDVIYSKVALVSNLVSGPNVLTFSDFRAIVVPGIVHIKIETDSAYKASFVAGVTSLRVKTKFGGNDLVFNGTTWSAGTADIKYSLLGHNYDLRVKVTSSAPNKKLKAIGIFYAESDGGSLQYGYSQIQKYRFSGNSDQTDFLVTNFLPNPDHLKIYDVTTGQVYRYPAFSIDGRTVKFNAGTFLVPNETIELFFDQSEGTGYDYSDSNANLLASNHLGSTDATLDKSMVGRGIMLRRPDGTLREITINNNDEIQIWSV